MNSNNNLPSQLAHGLCAVHTSIKACAGLRGFNDKIMTATMQRFNQLVAKFDHLTNCVFDQCGPQLIFNWLSTNNQYWTASEFYQVARELGYFRQ